MRQKIPTANENSSSYAFCAPAVVLAGWTMAQPIIPPKPLVANTTGFGTGGGVVEVLILGLTVREESAAMAGKVFLILGL